MTIRMSARVAGLAWVAAEATAVTTRVHDRPDVVVWLVILALQLAAVVWITDRRSAASVRKVAPAVLAALTVVAVWTALALAVPATAADNATALMAIAAGALFGAVSSRRGAGRRFLPAVLIASATTALLVYLAIAVLMPVVPGFIGHNHPPTYTDVTRLVDPIGELAIFVLLAVAVGVDGLRVHGRARRAAQRGEYVAGPNEMVVEPTVH